MQTKLDYSAQIDKDILSQGTIFSRIQNPFYSFLIFLIYKYIYM